MLLGLSRSPDKFPSLCQEDIWYGINGNDLVRLIFHEPCHVVLCAMESCSVFDVEIMSVDTLNVVLSVNFLP